MKQVMCHVHDTAQSWIKWLQEHPPKIWFKQFRGIMSMVELTKEEKLATAHKIMDKQRAEIAKAESKGKEVKEQPEIMWGNEMGDTTFIPTNIIEFDRLCGAYAKDEETGGFTYLGSGGLPRGRWTIWWGSKGCGKTTMALREVGVAQQMGLVVGYFDSEHALESRWCLKQGVNMDELIIWRGGNLEQNLNSMIEMMKAGVLDFIVIDTIHAFATKADTEGSKGKTRDMEDTPPQGRHADALSRFFRIATHRVSKANCAVLVIGQARAKDEFEQLTGGHALHHYNSLNLHFVRINAKDQVPSRVVPGAGKDGKAKKAPIGFIMKVKVDKTRVNHLDQQEIRVPFIWGLGPDNFRMNVLAAVKLDIIKKASSYYTLRTAEGPMKIQGEDNLMDWMRAPENEAYYDWLMAQITDGFVEPEDRKEAA